MHERSLRVFVSATSRDLGSYREVVVEALLKGEILPRTEEVFPPDHRKLEAVLRSEIEACDAVVCLVGFSYGTAPAEQDEQNQRSFTQLEYDWARALKKPLYIFLATERCRADRPLCDSDGCLALQKRHRDALLQGEYKYEFFSAKNELRLRIAEIIPQLIALKSPPLDAGQLRPDVAHAPPSPAFFVGRSDELDQLDRAMVRTAPSVIVVVGAGGQGKSTLVGQWWRESRVSAFNAVFWRTAYRGGYTFDQFLDDALAYLLEGTFDKSKRPEVQARVDALLKALHERKTLIVLDGVERWLRGWIEESPKDVVVSDRDARSGAPGLDNFLSAATGIETGTHVLLTTRAMPAVLDDAKCEVIPVHDENGASLLGLDDDSAVELVRKLGVKGSYEEISAVCRSYGNHPLALTVFSRMLVKRFGGRLERLDSVRAQGAKDRMFELLEETRNNLPGRRSSERFLQIASLCLENPSLPAMAAAMSVEIDGDESQVRDLLEQAITLADWHLLEWNARMEVVVLHPIIKQFFGALCMDAARIHSRLADWYCRQPIDPDASALKDVRSRLLAIEHALRAEEYPRCAELMFGTITPTYSFVNWLVAWGHFSTGIDVLGRLIASAKHDIKGALLATQGALCRQLGRVAQAKKCLDDAIAILEALTLDLSATHLPNLAGSLINRGNVLQQMGKTAESITDYDRAIQILGLLDEFDSGSRLHLASAFMNRGNALRDLGALTRAGSDCSRAVSLYREMMEAGFVNLESKIASALSNRSVVFMDKREFDTALTDLDQALRFFDRLVVQGCEEFKPNLAHAYGLRGYVSYELGHGEESLGDAHYAVRILTELVDEGRRELEPELALARFGRGLALLILRQYVEAAEDLHSAVSILNQRVQAGQYDLKGKLASTLIHLGHACHKSDCQNSCNSRDRGFELLRELCDASHPDRVLFLRLAVSTAEYLLETDPQLAIRLLHEALERCEVALCSADVTEQLKIEISFGLERMQMLETVLEHNGFEKTRISRLQRILG